jgi:hypothetical protein
VWVTPIFDSVGGVSRIRDIPATDHLTRKEKTPDMGLLPRDYFYISGTP